MGKRHPFMMWSSSIVRLLAPSNIAYMNQVIMNDVVGITDNKLPYSVSSLAALRSVSR